MSELTPDELHLLRVLKEVGGAMTKLALSFELRHHQNPREAISGLIKTGLIWRGSFRDTPYVGRGTVFVITLAGQRALDELDKSPDESA